MRLLVIEDTFAIAGRGLVVVPEVARDVIAGGTLRVELRRPDGTTIVADALAQIPFVSPPSARPLGYTLLFATLTKDDVPIGTEVWTT